METLTDNNQIKSCKMCHKPILRLSPRANNVKYCASYRLEVYKYKEYRSAYQRARNDTQATKETHGKLMCLICGKYYKKPISHAWQRHGFHEAEYKRAHGLDHKKGLITDRTREVLREHVKDNYAEVVEKNLLQNGKRSRFTKGDPRAGRYERSAQTLRNMRKK